MTLMPVSRISWAGARSSTEGAARWIGQRSSVSTSPHVVDRLAEEVEDPAERVVAHRDRDRPAGVDHVVAPLEAVGGVHRDRANAVVAEVLLHLQRQIHSSALVGLLDLDLESGVDLRQLAGERHVDDDAKHLVDAADVAAAVRGRAVRAGALGLRRGSAAVLAARVLVVSSVVSPFVSLSAIRFSLTERLGARDYFKNFLCDL